MPDHGYTQVIKKCDDKNAWDYEEWKAGKFIPTPNKLNIMKNLGFVFPENVETVEVKDVMKLAKKLTRQQYRARSSTTTTPKSQIQKNICKAILENGPICGNSLRVEWVPRQSGGIEMKKKDFCELHKSWAGRKQRESSKISPAAK